MCLSGVIACRELRLSASASDAWKSLLNEACANSSLSDWVGILSGFMCTDIFGWAATTHVFRFPLCAIARECLRPGKGRHKISERFGAIRKPLPIDALVEALPVSSRQSRSGSSDSARPAEWCLPVLGTCRLGVFPVLRGSHHVSRSAIE